MSRNKGFTLIELIIVIALIALLATTVILVINPVKIFKEARDSQRIADVGQMNSAMSLYTATAGTIAMGTANTCYAHMASGAAGTSWAASCNSRHTATLVATTTSQSVTTGTGWVPVNLTNVSGGQPLSAWPVDPKPAFTALATTSYYYSYVPDPTNTTWEFNAHMESDRYKNGGGDDVETTDGGSNVNAFEIGTSTAL